MLPDELVLGALEPPAALAPVLGALLVLGVLDPPAALDFLLDFDVAPELASLSFFLPLAAPLCLPLFMCSRPCASVVTFGFAVAPAAAPVFAPALAPDLSLFTSAPTFAPAEPWVVVLCAAAIWLNDTAKKPEIRTGNNLRIVVLLGWEREYLRPCCKARARKSGMSHAEHRERALQPRGPKETIMRKLFVLTLLAGASFSLAAQQQGEQGAPAAKDKPAPAKTQQERIRAEGAAGGTRPVPSEKRKAVGAGAGPHKRDHLPSPQKLPRDEPVAPSK